MHAARCSLGHYARSCPARPSWCSVVASALLFPDAPESWPSCLCHGLISFLGFFLLLLTFPISGWFALKVRLAAAVGELGGTMEAMMNGFPAFGPLPLYTITPEGTSTEGLPLPVATSVGAF